MKDAFGHGSNSHEGSLTEQLRARLAHVTSLKGAPSGGVAMTSNAAAGAALASTLKATQAPVHDAMAYQPGAFVSSRPQGDFASRLVDSIRGGQRGSRSFGGAITNLKGVHR